MHTVGRKGYKKDKKLKSRVNDRLDKSFQDDTVIDVNDVSGPPSSSKLREIAYLINVLHKRFSKRVVAILNSRLGHATASQVISILADTRQRSSLFSG